MDWLQIGFLVAGLPALAMGCHELTHVVVARIACPVSIERTSWIPLRLQLDFDQLPSKPTLRIVALAPLLVGSGAALIAIDTGVWQQLKRTDPYYFHWLTVAYWILYIVPSPADLRLALHPPAKPIDV